MYSFEVISRTIKIEAQTMPPEVKFIEKKIEEHGIEPLRWAIVDINGNELTLCVSGRILENVN